MELFKEISESNREYREVLSVGPRMITTICIMTNMKDHAYQNLRGVTDSKSDEWVVTHYEKVTTDNTYLTETIIADISYNSRATMLDPYAAFRIKIKDLSGAVRVVELEKNGSIRHQHILNPEMGLSLASGGKIKSYAYYPEVDEFISDKGVRYTGILKDSSVLDDIQAKRTILEKTSQKSI